jgi:hypothetical protein
MPRRSAARSDAKGLHDLVSGATWHTEERSLPRSLNLLKFTGQGLTALGNFIKHIRGLRLALNSVEWYLKSGK